MSSPLVPILMLVVVLSTSWVRPPAADGATHIFPLSLSGKAYRTFERAPGEKAPLHKVNDQIIAAIVQGINVLDFSSNKVRVDSSGRYFLYYDGKSDWRVATNTNGVNATVLTGQVANLGTFWMAGQYAAPILGPVANVFATGKVKFVKGTFDPKAIKGVMYFVSESLQAGLILKFKTVGAPIVGP